MTWLTGSFTLVRQHLIERGHVLARPPGVEEKETYWFRGVCLLRVAVFTAVMIWRGAAQLAKLRKLDSRSVRKSRNRL